MELGDDGSKGKAQAFPRESQHHPERTDPRFPFLVQQARGSSAFLVGNRNSPVFNDWPPSGLPNVAIFGAKRQSNWRGSQEIGLSSKRGEMF